MEDYEDDEPAAFAAGVGDARCGYTRTACMEG